MHACRFERLQLNDVIGRGASGQIFRGTLDGSPVAVKELVSVLFDPDEINEFVNEAASLAALRHPHIVSFYGISKKQTEDRGTRLLLVMELCDTSFHAVIVAVEQKHRLLAPPPSPSTPATTLGESPGVLTAASQISSSRQHTPAFFFTDMDINLFSGRRCVCVCVCACVCVCVCVSVYVCVCVCSGRTSIHVRA